MFLALINQILAPNSEQRFSLKLKTLSMRGSRRYFKESMTQRFQIYSPLENSSRNVPPRYIPPRNVPPRKKPNVFFYRFVATLFRLIARFARVRIEDSSGNSFVSTAYFTKPCFVVGECSGGKEPGWNLPGGIFRSPIKSHMVGGVMFA